MRPPSGRRVAIGRGTFAFGPRFGVARRNGGFITVVDRGLLPMVSELRWMTRDDFYGLRYEGLQGQRMRSEHYAGAWIAAHMLQTDPVLRPRFQAYLRGLRTSPTAEPQLWFDAFEGQDLDAMLRAYTAQPRIRFGYLPVHPRPPVEVRTSEMSLADAHLLWAQLLIGWDHRLEVRRHLAEVQALREDDAQRLLLLGTLDWLLSSPAEARSEIADAVRLDPELSSAAHASVVMSEGRSGEAFSQSVARLIQVAVTGDDLALAARAKLELGQAEEASRLAEMAVERDRSCWRCQAALGRARLALNQPREALAAVEMALALMGHSQSDARERLQRTIALLREATGAQSGALATPAAGSTEGRSRSAIREVIRLHLAEVRACYAAEVARNPGLGGRIMVRFVVAPDGQVTSARVTESSLSHPGVEACVVARLSTWRFVEFEGVTVITYPFVFTSAEGT